ncbi:14261_t:CDS:2, partial [Ambispora leptoticha]
RDEKNDNQDIDAKSTNEAKELVNNADDNKPLPTLSLLDSTSLPQISKNIETGSLSPNLREVIDDKGQTHYFNVVTNKMQWEWPVVEDNIEKTVSLDLQTEENNSEKIIENQYIARVDEAEILNQPLPLIKETWEEKFELINGIIVDKYLIEQSSNPVIDHRYSKVEYKKSNNMKISHASKICDSFMLSQGIEIDAISAEELKKFFRLFNLNTRNTSNNALLNDLKTHDVYCEITSEQVSVEYNIQNIKITAELKVAIDKALGTNTPIENLKHIFNKFGYLFAMKTVIGNKLQRIVRLNGDTNDNENKYPIYLPEFNEIDNETLNSWKKEIQPHDSTYLLTMDVFETEWRIIKRVVTPLYKILDIEQQQKIEKLFSNQDHILMTNTTTILDFNAGYQRIEFNDKLKSNKYQIFGNVVDANGQTFTNIYVKFSLKSDYGFSVNWIQDDMNHFETLQASYKLKWMLIGCPSEIGYFDATTRDKEIKTGSTEMKITSMKEAVPENDDLAQQWTCRINVDMPLSLSSVVSLNVEYPTTQKTPIFKASENISDSIIEVKIEPIDYGNVEFLNYEETTVIIRWCVLF